MTATLKREAVSPLHYFGGKYRLAPRIVSLMPPHHTYVEVFGGAAHVLFTKPPSAVEVYNDIDSRVVNFFRVLRDPQKAERLREMAENTPYSREEFYVLRDREEFADDVEEAWAFFVVNRMMFGASDGWGYDRAATSGGMARSLMCFLRATQRIEDAAQRLKRVIIEHDDWRKIIDRYDTQNTLFYLDPPYPLDTRRNHGYKYEMSDEDHRELADRLLSIEGMAILTTYPSPLYAVLERHGWRMLEFQRTCDAAGRIRGSGLQGDGVVKEKQQRTEIIWLSPKAQRQDKDYDILVPMP
jgi:DNA adenine methylase